jgi:glucose-1-phosphate adenylyltransferase
MHSFSTSGPASMLSSQLARESVALVLAGGNGTRLGDLTRWICKPALPFAGRYRNIDFSLSNCIHSGIRRVAVLTQYKAQALIRHLESAWNFLPRALGEFVEIWPAQQRIQPDWYTGTANAVLQNLDMLQELAPRFVVVLAGDHVYRMDYRRLLEQHARGGAGVTIACVSVPRAEAGQFGVVSMARDGLIQRFVEKPCADQLEPHQETVLASMGIYVFDAAYLYSLLAADALRTDSAHDFGRDLLPAAVEAGEAAAWLFEDPRTGRPGYWRDVGTVETYWRAHMELLDPRVDSAVFDPAWPILAQTASLPPTRFLRGTSAVVLTDSIVADGCTLDSAAIIHSVIGTGVTIGAGSLIEESVILPGAAVRPGTQLRRMVVAGNVQLQVLPQSGQQLRDGRMVA